MKPETKLKKVKNNLIKNNSFKELEADKAIKETLIFLNIKNYSVSYFTRFLINTYNVNGVER